MRRLAAVFTGRRSDKSEAGSNASNAGHSERSQPAVDAKTPAPPVKGRASFLRSLSKSSLSQGRKHTMPPVSTMPMPDQTGSSASSSSGGPRTPSDDQESIIPSQHGHGGRKSWLSQVSDMHLPLPPVPPKPMSRPYLPQHYGTRESAPVSEASSESGDVYEQEVRRAAPVGMTALPSPLAPTEYFRVITANALSPPYAPPPLLEMPSGPVYPRSCNPSHQLRRTDCLHARVLRHQLLGKLDRSHGGALAGFANRSHLPQTRSMVLDDVAIPKTARAQHFSQGLRRWTERPCFEDRYFVYLPAQQSDGELRVERVFASSAVEALAFAEHTEALAGLYDDFGPLPSPVSPNQPSSMASTPQFSLSPSTSSLPSVPPSPALSPPSAPLAPSLSKPNNAAYKAASAPSPLRIGSTDTIPEPAAQPSPDFAITPVVGPTKVPSPPAPAPRPPSISPPSPAVSPKPAVRFAEEEKDDAIPLEYVMRHRQARDKKARFLAAEKARRVSVQSVPAAAAPRYAPAPADAARDDAREARRLAEERRRMEEERRRFEEERRKLERERAVAEEQKRKQMYAEDFVEARRRQEKGRQSVVPKLGEGISWEGDRDRERRGSDTRNAYTRPRYDSAASQSRSQVPMPQRQSSEPNVHLGGSSGTNSPRLAVPYPDSSPGSSRPPSIAAGSNRGSSRPPSMYSTPPSSASLTDVRQRRESKTSRRSVMSDGGSYSPAMYYPPGTPGFPWGAVPPMPAMPVGMNMVPANMMPMNMNMAMPGMPMQMMQMQMPGMPYTDMPLLPPTPPFMQGYGKRAHASGQRSHSSSPVRSTAASDSKRRSDGSASGESRHHRRTPSDDVARRGRHSTPAAPQPSSASSTTRASRPPMPVQTQSQGSGTPPVPSSWPRQPAFQNLSRPTASRRQTMIT